MITIMPWKKYYYPHLTDEETEAESLCNMPKAMEVVSVRDQAQAHLVSGAQVLAHCSKLLPTMSSVRSRAQSGHWSLTSCF